MKKIGVLVSGGGSNLQAIIDAVHSGVIQAKIGVVISNKPGVYGLQRAEQAQIPAVVIDHRQYSTGLDFSMAILGCLFQHNIDIVCLAGFLRILDHIVVEKYPNRILNIHPALLPAFGGKGMYGHYVHEAVVASGAKFSGATVHFVTPETDAGPIITQGIVPVTDADTADTLAAKVLQIEHTIYPQAIKMVLEDKIKVDGLRVRMNTNLQL